MNLEGYDIVYVFGNLFMAYVIYQYMYVFYSSCKVNPWIERISYIGYFVCITLTHAFLKIPLAVLVANIILLLLLTLLYEGSLRKSLLSVSTIYVSLMLVETLLAFLTSTLKFNLLVPFHYESEFGIALIRVTSFVLVRFVKGFRNVKADSDLPMSYWISLIGIPLGTVFMLFSVFMNGNLPRVIVLGCMCCAFLINILSFYLYDKIAELMKERMDMQVTREQNRFYEYQVRMMKDTLDSIRVLRHDMKNKLSALYNMACEGKNEDLVGYLEELTDVSSQSKEYAHSGNVTIDSIINYKLQKAEERHIKITTDVIVPVELLVPAFDIAVVLGNLLDNALDAVSYVDEGNRWIDIGIKYSKGRLIVKISNAFDGTIIRNAEGIVSRKADKDNHGLGIKSVETTLEKYDGALQIVHEGQKFEAKVLMYL